MARMLVIGLAFFAITATEAYVFNVRQPIFSRFDNGTRINEAYSRILRDVKSYRDRNVPKNFGHSKEIMALNVSVQSAIFETKEFRSYYIKSPMRSLHTPEELDNMGLISQIITSQSDTVDPALNSAKYLNISATGHATWRSDIKEALSQLYKNYYDFCVTPKPPTIRFRLATYLAQRLITDDVLWFLAEAHSCINQLDNAENGCDIEALEKKLSESMKRIEDYLEIMKSGAEHEFPDRWCTSISPFWHSTQVADEYWSDPYPLSSSDRNISLKINGRRHDRIQIRLANAVDVNNPFHVIEFRMEGNGDASQDSWHNLTISLKKTEIKLIGEDGINYPLTLSQRSEDRTMYDFYDATHFSVRVLGRGKTRKLLLKSPVYEEPENVYWCSGSVGPDFFDSLGKVIYSADQFYSINQRPLMHEWSQLSWSATLCGCPDKELVEWKSREDFPSRAVTLGEDEFQWPNIFCQFTMDGMVRYGILTDHFTKCKVHGSEENALPMDSEDFQYLAYN